MKGVGQSTDVLSTLQFPKCNRNFRFNATLIFFLIYSNALSILFHIIGYHTTVDLYLPLSFQRIMYTCIFSKPLLCRFFDNLTSNRYISISHDKDLDPLPSKPGTMSCRASYGVSGVRILSGVLTTPILEPDSRKHRVTQAVVVCLV